MSTSALGSVKREERWTKTEFRVITIHSFWHKQSLVAFNSAKVTFLSIYKPSISDEIPQESGNLLLHFLYTLPGIIVRIGGFCESIIRICTGEVCVLNSRLLSDLIKNVSCISLAGCSGGKIQSIEIMIIIFNIRTFGYCKTHTFE